MIIVLEGLKFDHLPGHENYNKYYPSYCRSAPISATESLIGDWLEVSGMKTLDAKEYEALEKELGLESPINIHELVNTPSKYS